MMKKYAFVLYSVVSIAILPLFCCLTSCRPSDAEQANNDEKRIESKVALGETVGPGSTLVRPGDPLLPDGSGMSDDPDALLKTWAAGRFDELKGVDLVAKVRKHLDLKLITSVDPEMHEKLCLKISQFLEAYSTANFDAYMRFRGPGNLVGDDDERVQQHLAVVKENWAISQEYLPADSRMPTTGLDLLRMFWRQYIKPEAPPIPAVQWSSIRAAIATLPKKEVIDKEWPADGGSMGSHLYKAFLASRRANHSLVVTHTVVPNAGTIKDRLLDGERLIYADFEIIRRANADATGPVIVRLVWDPRVGDWLPWGMLPLYTDNSPLIW